MGPIYVTPPPRPGQSTTQKAGSTSSVGELPAAASPSSDTVTISGSTSPQNPLVPQVTSLTSSPPVGTDSTSGLSQSTESWDSQFIKSAIAVYNECYISMKKDLLNPPADLTSTGNITLDQKDSDGNAMTVKVTTVNGGGVADYSMNITNAMNKIIMVMTIMNSYADAMEAAVARLEDIDASSDQKDANRKIRQQAAKNRQKMVQNMVDFQSKMTENLNQLVSTAIESATKANEAEQKTALAKIDGMWKDSSSESANKKTGEYDTKRAELTAAVKQVYEEAAKYNAGQMTNYYIKIAKNSDVTDLPSVGNIDASGINAAGKKFNEKITKITDELTKVSGTFNADGTAKSFKNYYNSDRTATPDAAKDSEGLLTQGYTDASKKEKSANIDYNTQLIKDLRDELTNYQNTVRMFFTIIFSMMDALTDAAENLDPDSPKPPKSAQMSQVVTGILEQRLASVKTAFELLNQSASLYRVALNDRNQAEIDYQKAKELEKAKKEAIGVAIGVAIGAAILGAIITVATLGAGAPVAALLIAGAVVAGAAAGAGMAANNLYTASKEKDIENKYSNEYYDPQTALDSKAFSFMQTMLEGVNSQIDEMEEKQKQERLKGQELAEKELNKLMILKMDQADYQMKLELANRDKFMVDTHDKMKALDGAQLAVSDQNMAKYQLIIQGITMIMQSKADALAAAVAQLARKAVDTRYIDTMGQMVNAILSTNMSNYQDLKNDLQVELDAYNKNIEKDKKIYDLGVQIAFAAVQLVVSVLGAAVAPLSAMATVATGVMYGVLQMGQSITTYYGPYGYGNSKFERDPSVQAALDKALDPGPEPPEPDPKKDPKAHQIWQMDRMAWKERTLLNKLRAEGTRPASQGYSEINYRAVADVQKELDQIAMVRMMIAQIMIWQAEALEDAVAKISDAPVAGSRIGQLMDMVDTHNDAMASALQDMVQEFESQVTVINRKRDAEIEFNAGMISGAIQVGLSVLPGVATSPLGKVAGRAITPVISATAPVISSLSSAAYRFSLTQNRQSYILPQYEILKLMLKMTDDGKLESDTESDVYQFKGSYDIGRGMVALDYGQLAKLQFKLEMQRRIQVVLADIIQARNQALLDAAADLDPDSGGAPQASSIARQIANVHAANQKMVAEYLFSIIVNQATDQNRVAQQIRSMISDLISAAVSLAVVMVAAAATRVRYSGAKSAPKPPKTVPPRPVEKTPPKTPTSEKPAKTSDSASSATSATSGAKPKATNLSASTTGWKTLSILSSLQVIQQCSPLISQPLSVAVMGDDKTAENAAKLEKDNDISDAGDREDALSHYYNSLLRAQVAAANTQALTLHYQMSTMMGVAVGQGFKQSTDNLIQNSLQDAINKLLGLTKVKQWYYQSRPESLTAKILRTYILANEKRNNPSERIEAIEKRLRSEFQTEIRMNQLIPFHYSSLIPLRNIPPISTLIKSLAFIGGPVVTPEMLIAQSMDDVMKNIEMPAVNRESAKSTAADFDLILTTLPPINEYSKIHQTSEVIKKGLYELATQSQTATAGQIIQLHASLVNLRILIVNERESLAKDLVEALSVKAPSSEAVSAINEKMALLNQYEKIFTRYGNDPRGGIAAFILDEYHDVQMLYRANLIEADRKLTSDLSRNPTDNTIQGHVQNIKEKIETQKKIMQLNTGIDHLELHDALEKNATLSSQFSAQLQSALAKNVLGKTVAEFNAQVTPDKKNVFEKRLSHNQRQAIRHLADPTRTNVTVASFFQSMAGNPRLQLATDLLMLFDAKEIGRSEGKAARDQLANMPIDQEFQRERIELDIAKKIVKLPRIGVQTAIDAASETVLALSDMGEDGKKAPMLKVEKMARIIQAMGLIDPDAAKSILVTALEKATDRQKIYLVDAIDVAKIDIPRYTAVSVLKTPVLSTIIKYIHPQQQSSHTVADYADAGKYVAQQIDTTAFLDGTSTDVLAESERLPALLEEQLIRVSNLPPNEQNAALSNLTKITDAITIRELAWDPSTDQKNQSAPESLNRVMDQINKSDTFKQFVLKTNAAVINEWIEKEKERAKKPTDTRVIDTALQSLSTKFGKTIQYPPSDLILLQQLTPSTNRSFSATMTQLSVNMQQLQKMSIEQPNYVRHQVTTAIPHLAEGLARELKIPNSFAIAMPALEKLVTQLRKISDDRAAGGIPRSDSNLDDQFISQLATQIQAHSTQTQRTNLLIQLKSTPQFSESTISRQLLEKLELQIGGSGNAAPDENDLTPSSVLVNQILTELKKMDRPTTLEWLKMNSRELGKSIARLLVVDPKNAIDAMMNLDLLMPLRSPTAAAVATAIAAEITVINQENSFGLSPEIHPSILINTERNSPLMTEVHKLVTEADHLAAAKIITETMPATAAAAFTEIYHQNGTVTARSVLSALIDRADVIKIADLVVTVGQSADSQSNEIAKFMVDHIQDELATFTMSSPTAKNKAEKLAQVLVAIDTFAKNRSANSIASLVTQPAVYNHARDFVLNPQLGPAVQSRVNTVQTLLSNLVNPDPDSDQNLREMIQKLGESIESLSPAIPPALNPMTHQRLATELKRTGKNWIPQTRQIVELVAVAKAVVAEQQPVVQSSNAHVDSSAVSMQLSPATQAALVSYLAKYAPHELVNLANHAGSTVPPDAGIQAQFDQLNQALGGSLQISDQPAATPDSIRAWRDTMLALLTPTQNGPSAPVKTLLRHSLQINLPTVAPEIAVNSVFRADVEAWMKSLGIIQPPGMLKFDNACAKILRACTADKLGQATSVGDLQKMAKNLLSQLEIEQQSRLKATISIMTAASKSAVVDLIGQIIKSVNLDAEVQEQLQPVISELETLKTRDEITQTLQKVADDKTRDTDPTIDDSLNKLVMAAPVNLAAVRVQWPARTSAQPAATPYWQALATAVDSIQNSKNDTALLTRINPNSDIKTVQAAQTALEDLVQDTPTWDSALTKPLAWEALAAISPSRITQLTPAELNSVQTQLTRKLQVSAANLANNPAKAVSEIPALIQMITAVHKAQVSLLQPIQRQINAVRSALVTQIQTNPTVAIQTTAIQSQLTQLRRAMPVQDNPNEAINLNELIQSQGKSQPWTPEQHEIVSLMIAVTQAQQQPAADATLASRLTPQVIADLVRYNPESLLNLVQSQPDTEQRPMYQAIVTQVDSIVSAMDSRSSNETPEISRNLATIISKLPADLTPAKLVQVAGTVMTSLLDDSLTWDSAPTTPAEWEALATRFPSQITTVQADKLDLVQDKLASKLSEAVKVRSNHPDAVTSEIPALTRMMTEVYTKKTVSQPIPPEISGVMMREPTEQFQSIYTQLQPVLAHQEVQRQLDNLVLAQTVGQLDAVKLESVRGDIGEPRALTDPGMAQNQNEIAATLTFLDKRAQLISNLEAISKGVPIPLNNLVETVTDADLDAANTTLPPENYWTALTIVHKSGVNPTSRLKDLDMVKDLSQFIAGGPVPVLQTAAQWAAAAQALPVMVSLAYASDPPVADPPPNPDLETISSKLLGELSGVAGASPAKHIALTQMIAAVKLRQADQWTQLVEKVREIRTVGQQGQPIDPKVRELVGQFRSMLQPIFGLSDIQWTNQMIQARPPEVLVNIVANLSLPNVSRTQRSTVTGLLIDTVFEQVMANGNFRPNPNNGQNWWQFWSQVGQTPYPNADGTGKNRDLSVFDRYATSPDGFAPLIELAVQCFNTRDRGAAPIPEAASHLFSQISKMAALQAPPHAWVKPTLASVRKSGVPLSNILKSVANSPVGKEIFRSMVVSNPLEANGILIQSTLPDEVTTDYWKILSNPQSGDTPDPVANVPAQGAAPVDSLSPRFVEAVAGLKTRGNQFEFPDTIHPEISQLGFDTLNEFIQVPTSTDLPDVQNWVDRVQYLVTQNLDTRNPSLLANWVSGSDQNSVRKAVMDGLLHYVMPEAIQESNPDLAQKLTDVQKSISELSQKLTDVQKSIKDLDEVIKWAQAVETDPAQWNQVPDSILIKVLERRIQDCGAPKIKSEIRTSAPEIINQLSAEKMIDQLIATYAPETEVGAQSPIGAGEWLTMIGDQPSEIDYIVKAVLIADNLNRAQFINDIFGYSGLFAGNSERRELIRNLVRSLLNGQVDQISIISQIRNASARVSRTASVLESLPEFQASSRIESENTLITTFPSAENSEELPAYTGGDPAIAGPTAGPEKVDVPSLPSQIGLPHNAAADFDLVLSQDRKNPIAAVEMETKFQAVLVSPIAVNEWLNKLEKCLNEKDFLMQNNIADVLDLANFSDRISNQHRALVPIRYFMDHLDTLRAFEERGLIKPGKVQVVSDKISDAISKSCEDKIKSAKLTSDTIREIVKLVAEMGKSSASKVSKRFATDRIRQLADRITDMNRTSDPMLGEVLNAVVDAAADHPDFNLSFLIQKLVPKLKKNDEKPVHDAAYRPVRSLLETLEKMGGAPDLQKSQWAHAKIMVSLKAIMVDDSDSDLGLAHFNTASQTSYFMARKIRGDVRGLPLGQFAKKYVRGLLESDKLTDESIQNSLKSWFLVGEQAIKDDSKAGRLANQLTRQYLSHLLNVAGFNLVPGEISSEKPNKRLESIITVVKSASAIPIQNDPMIKMNQNFLEVLAGTFGERHHTKDSLEYIWKRLFPHPNDLNKTDKFGRIDPNTTLDADQSKMMLSTIMQAAPHLLFNSKADPILRALTPRADVRPGTKYTVVTGNNSYVATFLSRPGSENWQLIDAMITMMQDENTRTMRHHFRKVFSDGILTLPISTTVKWIQCTTGDPTIRAITDCFLRDYTDPTGGDNETYLHRDDRRLALIKKLEAAIKHLDSDAGDTGRFQKSRLERAVALLRGQNVDARTTEINPSNPSGGPALKSGDGSGGSGTGGGGGGAGHPDGNRRGSDDSQLSGDNGANAAVGNGGPTQPESTLTLPPASLIAAVSPNRIDVSGKVLTSEIEFDQSEAEMVRLLAPKAVDAQGNDTKPNCPGDDSDGGGSELSEEEIRSIEGRMEDLRNSS